MEGMLGATVAGPQGEDVGELYDVIFTDAGEIQSVIVESSGFLGIGGKLVDVPYDQVEMAPGGDQVSISMTEEEFEQAPEFEYTGDENALRGE
jgi:sporulation protein YlmC with PRC-barrel domain